MEHVVPADWTAESTFWRDNYKARPYFKPDRDYAYYEPAYRYGFESATRYRGKSWSEAERDVEREWEHYAERGEWLGHSPFFPDSQPMPVRRGGMHF